MLVVNFISDVNAATKVCNFLGYNDKFHRPRRNVNPKSSINPQNENMFLNCISELGLKEEELNYDIFSPSLEPSEFCCPVDTRFIS